MNKISIIGVLVFLLLFSCSEKKETKIIDVYNINGSVYNANSKKAYLYNIDNKLLDSTTIQNSKFHFVGTTKSPQLASIQLKEDAISIPIILENSDYQLYTSLGKQLVFGGKLQQIYNTYLEGLNTLENSKLVLTENFNQHSKNTSKLSDLFTKIDSVDAVILNYKLSNLKSISFSPIKSKIVNSILNNGSLSINQVLEIKAITAIINDSNINTIVSTALENLKAIELEKELEAIKKAQLNKPKRQLAPMFLGEGLNGSDLALSSVLNGKKVVLIDFWASWCGPCRLTSPEIRSLYTKYKDKGFDILTVSEDRNKESWKAGLAEDQILMWNHIYDDMRIAQMFNVSSIPHMVLLDGNGGIIDRKISLTRLKSELATICK